MFELTFDVSISSYLPALIKGACVFTVPNDVIKNIYVLKLISKYELTVLQIVPSVILLSLPLIEKISSSSVKYCILTGEATPVDLLSIWKRAIYNAEIYNYYGPTEATIYCSYYDCNQSVVKSYNGMIAIGKAFDQMELIIIDSDNNVLEDNQKGELLICGKQLTKGYFNNEEKNLSSFIILSNTEKVYYRSGDLCYKDSEGDIFYCGRIDNQVKIQGFRVELSEIEVNVRITFGINNIVVPRTTKNNALELVLVIEKDKKSKSDEIHQMLKEKLPDYMIPSKIVTVDNFPLNSSGKIDRAFIKRLVNES